MQVLVIDESYAAVFQCISHLCYFVADFLELVCSVFALCWQFYVLTSTHFSYYLILLWELLIALHKFSTKFSNSLSKMAYPIYLVPFGVFLFPIYYRHQMSAHLFVHLVPPSLVFLGCQKVVRVIYCIVTF